MKFSLSNFTFYYKMLEADGDRTGGSLAWQASALTIRLWSQTVKSSKSTEFCTYKIENYFLPKTLSNQSILTSTIGLHHYFYVPRVWMVYFTKNELVSPPGIYSYNLRDHLRLDIRWFKKILFLSAVSSLHRNSCIFNKIFWARWKSA